ncbi:uncharacterized protein JCM6883_004367 [Sporobolomyces salmoneus]|uniref:uncharacterized protein n=1 Tax=Sporobolomyces salmoneus TaxID=183962 RepID=UPI003172D50F
MVSSPPKPRARAMAPVPPTPSPRKPVIPPSPLGAGPYLNTPNERRRNGDGAQTNYLESDEKPSLAEFASARTTTLKTEDEESQRSTTRRDRSLAPEYLESEERSKMRIKKEREDEYAQAGMRAREEEEVVDEKPPLFRVEEEQEEDQVLAEEERDLGDGREIDYEDEPDIDSGGEGAGSDSTERRTVEPEEEEEESDESEEEEPRDRPRKRKRRRDVSSQAQLKRKRKKEELEREKERQEQELAQRETESKLVWNRASRRRASTDARGTASSFLDSSGVDPRPTQISAKARLTNEIALKTSHFPSQHQVLAVKEPPTRYPRSPSPPPARSRHKRATIEPKEKEASATPRIPPPDSEQLAEPDDLEDYVGEGEQLPPEDLLEDRVKLEFELVVEKPRKLKTKEEAILRWKEETNLVTDRARVTPGSFRWNDYRTDWENLKSLKLNLSTPLPPVLKLPRTFEAHQDLLNLRPPSSYTLLAWDSIFDPTPPAIDSDSRLSRANWQLSNFISVDGFDKLSRQVEKDGIEEEELLQVATEVFELDEADGLDKFDLQIVYERNWLFAEQIVQLARIRNAYQSIASTGAIEALSSALRDKSTRFEHETRRLEAERNSLPRTIGNSQWILKLNTQIEALKFDHRESVEKIQKLKKNLAARLEGA